MRNPKTPAQNKKPPTFRPGVATTTIDPTIVLFVLLGLLETLALRRRRRGGRRLLAEIRRRILRRRRSRGRRRRRSGILLRRGLGQPLHDATLDRRHLG